MVRKRGILERKGEQRGNRVGMTVIESALEILFNVSQMCANKRFVKGMVIVEIGGIESIKITCKEPLW